MGGDDRSTPFNLSKATRSDPMVKWTRLGTFLMLAATTVVVGTLTFKALGDTRQVNLQKQFTIHTDQLLAVSSMNARDVFNSVKMFSELYPTVAVAAGKTLPFVTLTEFEQLAQSTRRVSGATQLVYVPLIIDDGERTVWQEYSVLHGTEWIQTSFEYYPDTPQFVDTDFNEFIWKYDGTTSSNNGLGEIVPSPEISAPYAPSWQSSPPPLHPELIVNFDYASDPVFARLMQWTLSTRLPGLSPPVSSYQVLHGSSANDEESLTLEESIVFQPIFDSVPVTPTSEVKGHVAASIPWTHYFSDILAPSSFCAIDVVIQSSCDPLKENIITIKVTGSTAEYVGQGDMHDSEFNSFKVVSDPKEATGGGFHSLFNDNLSQEDWESEAYCGPTFTMYPTTTECFDTKDGAVSASDFNTSNNDAVLYTVIFVLLLVVSLGCLALYDNSLWNKLDATVVPTTASTNAKHVDTPHVNTTDDDDDEEQRTGAASGGGADTSTSSHGAEPEPPVVVSFERNVSNTMMPSMSAAAGVSAVPTETNSEKQTGTNLDAVKSAVANLEAAAENARNEPTSGAGSDGAKDTTAAGDKKNDKSKDALMKFVGGGVKATTGKPIAELFPEATVLFADISGFTAWSSIREPSQVFMLLESIFGAFDKIANERSVFKVETVGDCYVAVCGLPEPNQEHAIVMARFARECMEKVNEVISELELTLGPDTAELAMRFGLHSGPVTAGVLRGDRARFQLFGDTVNTASRIETTGKRNRIHLSEQTASLIIAAGLKSWVIEREDEVQAKGKGLIKTYWLLTLRGDHAEKSNGEGAAGEKKADAGTEHLPKSSFMERIKAIKEARASKQQRISRLIDWNSEMLIQLLKQVVARRNALQRKKTSEAALAAMAKNIGVGTMVVEEVAEIITLPEFDARLGKSQINPKVELPPGVAEQTRKYVAVLAGMYRNNPFHNFEHASHVTMSVSKLLSRIVAPQLDKSLTDEEADRQALLHDHTYGITSDPLTQFAVVLSALIHDVDHRGVPNFLLIQEDKHLAAAYQNKSVAEQNSLDLAWQALMGPEFDALRACIFSDISELRRFRQLLVNSVIATDIFDKELATARKARWDKAFSEDFHEAHRTAINRKATIVIEHLIQASDVAHTMQHWHVYTKWNERLFEEMYSAYQTGRWDKDPSVGWFEGEIGFLDNYVIPLAKKLKNCGVFGVASDEYLNYAEQNRREWQARGKEIVATFVERHAKKERVATQAAEAATEEKKVIRAEDEADKKEADKKTEEASKST